MKERPILFKGEMVRAIIEDRKIKTRRIVKPQPTEAIDVGASVATFIDRRPLFDKVAGKVVGTEDVPVRCPYGVPGDRLWVRERWRTLKSWDDKNGTQIAEQCLDAGYVKPWGPAAYVDETRNENWCCFNTASCGATPGRWRHARFMPRWASRLTLEITDVRVERLQDISEEDARAEGASPTVMYHARPGEEAVVETSYRQGFEILWRSINGAQSWERNDWLWVISFKRVDTAQTEREGHAA